MSHEALSDIAKLESDLWEAADNLRANSKLTSSDYLAFAAAWRAATGFSFARWATDTVATKLLGCSGCTPARYVPELSGFAGHFGRRSPGCSVGWPAKRRGSARPICS